MAEIKDLQDRVAALEAKANGRNSPTPTTTPPQSATPPAAKPTRLQITNSPQTPQSSALFRLSTELRFEIYRLVVPEEKYIDVDSNGYARPALLNTCKEIYLETIPIFYAKHVFRLSTRKFDPAVAARWHYETKHLLKRPSAVIFTTWVPHWEHLVEWVEKYRAGDVVLRLNGKNLSQTQRYQEAILHSVFKFAHPAMERPWEVVKDLLDDVRSALTAIEPRWDQD